ncbi:hypothetical protein EVAR_16965_1 [Eumeta japonica]|uniref:Uncharacterized protein n=1 Tax=Eumeta variegata TaxID=151549 RepID=A0A4C1TVH9_EUMVA|nr:hypothetical protein EVAR_16965_1 [Eumeta japonica]
MTAAFKAYHCCTAVRNTIDIDGAAMKVRAVVEAPLRMSIRSFVELPHPCLWVQVRDGGVASCPSTRRGYNPDGSSGNG